MKTIHQARPYRPPGHGCGPPTRAGAHPGHSHGGSTPWCGNHFKQPENNHFPMKLQDPGDNAHCRQAGGRLGEPSLPMKRCISKVGSFRRNDRVGLSFLQEPLVSRNTATNIPTACSRVGYSADVGPYFFHEPRFSRNTASHIPAVLEPAA